MENHANARHAILSASLVLLEDACMEIHANARHAILSCAPLPHTTVRIIHFSSAVFGTTTRNAVLSCAPHQSQQNPAIIHFSLAVCGALTI